MKKVRLLFVIVATALSFVSCSNDGPNVINDAPVVTKMIDLHLHLDGAISLNSARELAKMQNITIPEDPKELEKLMRVSPDCKDLNEFLE